MTKQRFEPRAHQPQPKNLLTRSELCEELGICTRTLRRYELANMIKPVRLSKRALRYRRSDIDAMLEKFSS